MAKTKKTVKIYLDPVANTMQIFWDDPEKAHTSEEVGSLNSNDVIIKDKYGRPISLEVIGIFPKELNIVRYLRDKIGVKLTEPTLLQS